MDFPITGPAYQHPSQATNFQRCVNYFNVPAGDGGVGTGTLLLTPGLSLLHDFGSSSCRGVYTRGSYIYTVIGSTLYNFNFNPVTRVASNFTTIGTLSSSTGSVYFSSNQTQIIITDTANHGYIVTIDSTGSSTAFAIISDSDFLGASNITYLDGYFIYNKPNTQYMYTSQLQDGTSWDALDVASAEVHPDNLIGLGVTKGEVWAFGDETIEVWYDAANQTGFPLSPRVGSQIDIGCAAVGSILTVDNVLMWLDSRGYIVQSTDSAFTRNNNTGYALKIVSTDALNSEIASYVQVNDAIAISFNDRGHIIYQITFPNANKTWAYDTTTGQWHEKMYYNTFTDKEEYHIAQYHTDYNNLNIVGGLRDGKLYIMHSDYFDDAGNLIHRIRTTAHQNNEFKLIGVDEIEIRLDTGYAPQGISPTMLMRYSNDSGHMWSNYLSRDMGLVGQYGKRITWNRLGTSYNWLFEFMTTAAVKFAIVFGSATANIEDNGQDKGQNNG